MTTLLLIRHGETDANGKWLRVVDDLGFPAGMERTMVADLTGKLPVGTRRIATCTTGRARLA